MVPYRLSLSFFCFLLLLLSSCFGGGVDKKGSVSGYKSGVVVTEGGSFRVGPLPSDWVRRPFGYKAILFVHRTKRSSIGVDAFCKRSFDDAPLEVLTRQLFYDLTDQHTLAQREVQLDGRQALRTTLSGRLDGAPVMLDVVVLKMNECLFDFFYVSSPGQYADDVAQFESFTSGFKYVKGP